MPPRPLEHPAIEQLASTPEILRLLMEGVSEEQTQAKPAPDRWSISEVLEHLSHVEAHCFRVRLDRLLAEVNPQLESYDQNTHAAQGAYSNREAEESFAHWEEQRESNVAALRQLDASKLTRQGAHPELGTVTLEQILNHWAFHDLAHVKQIAELVRTELYRPNLGPFAEFFPG